MKEWLRDIVATALVTLLLCLWAYIALNAEEKPVAISVPKTCEAPCELEVLISVIPNKDNYRLVLMWANVLDNDVNAGTQHWVIDGPTLVYRHKLVLPKGYYYLSAMLYRRPKGLPIAESDGYVAVDVEPPGGENDSYASVHPP